MNSPRVVIITGMSGAGRGTTAHILEDAGWFVVDNLPPSMMTQLLSEAVSRDVERLAVGLDVRSRDALDQLPQVLSELKDLGAVTEIIFMDASDEAIVKRQESARRPLPLQGTGTLTEAIAKERAHLAHLRAAADVVFDTSSLTTNQLATRVTQVFGGELSGTFSLLVMSFGFKHGLPMDADMVFDARFLPNPYWVPELRHQSGLDEGVAEFVLCLPPAQAFVTQVTGLLEGVRPGYIREGKRSAVVAVGCTGGQHRSVALAEAIAHRLTEPNWSATTMHRDLHRS
ncbi:MAG: RNase adapter RapZ [Propionibacteriaceae bacterium]|jgi:UPF0042 nucleotide-binding protein|nr:RNase adapter RapZ [Propionibacteriaceae bacterium]